MVVLPVKLDRQGEDRLTITWNDGQRRMYSIRGLRDACPCATCREKRTGAASKPEPYLPILSMEETLPLRLNGLKPVGNYAYSASFSDGHDTGIYTFELLRQLGEPSPG